MGTITISEMKKKIIAEIKDVCRTPIFFYFSHSHFVINLGY